MSEQPLKAIITKDYTDGSYEIQLEGQSNSAVAFTLLGARWTARRMMKRFRRGGSVGFIEEVSE